MVYIFRTLKYVRGDHKVLADLTVSHNIIYILNIYYHFKSVLFEMLYVHTDAIPIVLTLCVIDLVIVSNSMRSPPRESIHIHSLFCDFQSLPIGRVYFSTQVQGWSCDSLWPIGCYWWDVRPCPCRCCKCAIMDWCGSLYFCFVPWKQYVPAGGAVPPVTE